MSNTISAVSTVAPAGQGPASLVLQAPGGRFDAHEAPGFHRMFESAVESGARSITIDLANVVFMDSTALAELVSGQRLLQGVGGSMVLANPSDLVRVILDVTGLTPVFAVCLRPTEQI